MRGYFAIGAERISKPLNLGNLLRSAHAFGAKFFFTIGAHPKAFEAHSDTSKAHIHLPVYHWANAGEMVLPLRCKLVGIELIEGATDLPAFPPSSARGLCARTRARRAFGRTSFALRPRDQNSDCFLHKRRHGRSDRNVRPRTKLGDVSRPDGS